jgi:threonine/homoserine/homoserine lactone efflux protein
MMVYLMLGITYGFAAAVQPGPLTTYLISQTLSSGWRRTMPAILAPLISDGPIAILMLLLLSRVPTGMVHWLRLLGGLFLFYLAWGAWKTWWQFDEKVATFPRSSRQSMLNAALVNLLNPNPYLGWSLVLGPLLLKGWRETPANGVSVVAGFYSAMIASLAIIILIFHAARNLGPRVNRALVGVSAVALACFGLYQLWLGVMAP